MKYDLNKMLKDARKEASDLDKACYVKNVIEIFVSKLNMVVNEIVENISKEKQNAKKRRHRKAQT